MPGRLFSQVCTYAQVSPAGLTRGSIVFARWIAGSSPAMTRWDSHVLAAIAVLLVASGWQRPAAADDFFAGKTISMSTHSDVGGGYDAYLRLLARHMGQYVPGHPSFTVLNQPGAGGRLAVENAAKAPHDGTFLTLVAQSMLTMGVTAGPALSVPLGAFTWVGNFDQSNNVTVTWAASNVKTLQDAIAREVVVGATGAGTASELGPNLYNALLGTRFKVKVGYSGGDAIDTAMRRGEVDGRANSIWASIKMTLHDDILAHNVNVLIQNGRAQGARAAGRAAPFRTRPPRCEEVGDRRVHVAGRVHGATACGTAGGP